MLVILSIDRYFGTAEQPFDDELNVNITCLYHDDRLLFGCAL